MALCGPPPLAAARSVGDTASPSPIAAAREVAPFFYFILRKFSSSEGGKKKETVHLDGASWLHSFAVPFVPLNGSRCLQFYPRYYFFLASLFFSFFFLPQLQVRSCFSVASAIEPLSCFLRATHIFLFLLVYTFWSHVKPFTLFFL